MRHYIKEILAVMIIAILIFLLLRLIFSSYAVISQTMLPGIQPGERLLIYKTAYLFSGPQRGDIVYYKTPDEELDQLKRVIGLPGDRIEIKNSQIFINGILINEPYIAEKPQYTVLPFQVSDGCYFILGDNRNNSNDSSSGWTVPKKNITGRAWILIWPPGKWGSVNNFPLNLQPALSGKP